MWKYCEIEICPWHEPRIKRKEKVQSSHSRSGHKKKMRRRSESISKEKSNQRELQETNACKTAKVIPSESETNEVQTKNDTKETKDKSPKVNELKKKEIVADKTSKSSKSEKDRPKTAPPVHHHQVVVPMDPMRALASLDLMSARGLETPDQVEMGEFGDRECYQIVRKTEVMPKKVDVDAYKIWNDYCEAHEAYQFLRKKHTTKYGEFVPSPTYSKVSY